MSFLAAVAIGFKHDVTITHLQGLAITDAFHIPGQKPEIHPRLLTTQQLI